MAVVGENGVGKSTLLYAIDGLVSFVSGEILINRESLAPRDVYARFRNGIQLVPQHAYLSAPSLSFGDALLMAVHHREGVNNEVAINDLVSIIRRSDWVEDRLTPRQFDLIVAVLSVPRVLLLDEILPALKLRTVSVYENLRRLLALTSVIFTDHDIERALSVAGYVLWLKDEENPEFFHKSNRAAILNVRQALGGVVAQEVDRELDQLHDVLSLDLSPYEQLCTALLTRGLGRLEMEREKRRLIQEFPFLASKNPSEELSGGERIVLLWTVLELSRMSRLPSRLFEHLAAKFRDKIAALRSTGEVSNVAEYIRDANPPSTNS